MRTLKTNLKELTKRTSTNNSTTTQEDTMKRRMYKGLELDLHRLGYGRCSLSTLPVKNISDVESMVTDDENGTVLGFSIADGEAMQADQDYMADATFARAYAEANPYILKGFSIDELNEEVLIELVMQHMDDTRATGYATYVPEVKISFQKYYSNHDVWGGLSRGTYGINFKGQSNYVPVVRNGKLDQKVNAHVITRDMEDVFTMENGRITGVQEDTVNVTIPVKLDNGKFGKKIVARTMDIVSIYARSLNVMLDGTTHRVIVDCPELFHFIGTAEGTDEDLVEIALGVYLRKPQSDRESDRQLLSDEFDKNLVGQAGMLPSSVATRAGLWDERRAEIAEGYAMDRYAKRSAAGKVAKEMRKNIHADKVLLANPELTSLLEVIVDMGEVEVRTFINEALEEYSPAEILKVSRAFMRANDGKGLPLKIARELTSMKRETQSSVSHPVLEMLNDESTKQKAIDMMYGNIELIKAVLETAERNLNTYKYEVKKYGKQNVKRSEFLLISDYNVYKLLKGIVKQHAAA